MEEMEAVKILKEETKLTLSDLHDFAKWKLTAAAALASIGLGLKETQVHSQVSLWLLVFIPYICLFVDLNIYNYNLRLLVISKVIKESCKADNLIRIYESTCEKGCRRNGVFTSATLAQLGSTIMFSMLSIYAFFQSSGGSLVYEVACWGVGMLLIALFYMDYESKRNKIIGKSVSTSCSS
ncbi:MAG: hypothetical protein D3906_18190 [Candidatus Electrothrix sp. AUS1_2]|nr:hypothetical protein [Candidatus Electrothrix sp. AUS1_2]